ncbi:MAG: hypothetical protein ABW277_26190 [Longimicrobiaceae bacterium]
MNRNQMRAFRALAVAAGLGASATGLSAQKALVYCPVGIDATGCSSVAAALGGSFPDGVDRGYDGTGGTLDLKTADLTGYALVVVPSLSDNPGKAPFALLRAPEVAERLSAVLTGRVAVWSGTPDQGKGNREAKNALLRNLAAHAVGDGGGPALLVLQDASAAVSERYGWLAGISGRSIGVRPGARVFGFARGLSEAGSRVLDHGGARLAFGNMASFGLVLPDGSDWTADVEGTDAAVAYGGSALSGHGGASAAGALAGRLRALWARMFAAYNVVLATSPGAAGSTAKPALTLSVQPDSVVALVAGAATANLRANLATMGSCNAGQLANVRVNFSITPTLKQDNTALSSGEASWNAVNLSGLTLGTSYPVAATSTLSGNCASNSATGALRVKKGTALLDVSASGGGAGASTTLQAKLVDRSPPPGNTGIQGATVSFTVGSGTFTASTVGNGTATAAGTLPAAPGTYKVYVRYAGSESPSFYMAAVDSSQSVVVTSAAATGLAASAATGVYGGTTSLAATLTAGGSPVAGKTIGFTVNGTAACGGSTGVACPATNASGVASLAGVSLAGIGAGTYATGVGVSFAGDGGYLASNATGSLTVGKADQAALSLSGVPASAAYNSSFTVTPGGGSGSAPLVVTTSGVCSASGNDVTMTSGTGSCTVKVNRAGDANYNAASEVSASASASKLSQAALSLLGVPASAPFNSTFTVTPGGGSSSASLVVSAAGVCSISGNDVTMTSGTGSCTVKVNRAGDNNYDAAAEVTASANASKLSQAALSLLGVPSSAPYNSTFTVTPGGGNGSAALVVTTSGVCSISGNDVTMTSGTGSCTVKVNRAGDDNYDAAAEVTASANASKLSQAALSLLGVPASAPFNSTFTVTPGGGSGSASLVVTASGVCSVSGNDVTMTSGTGSCIVRVNRAGDDNYNAASEVTASANASKLSQAALSLLGVPASAPFNSTFTVTPGGGSGSASLVVTTSGVCSISGNDVTMTSGTGSCNVKVNRAGDDNYDAAAEVTASANASKLSQAALSLLGVPASAPFNSTFTVTPGGGSGSASLVVTTSGVCSISGNDVTMTSGTGSCTVKVNRAGDDNYNAAAEVTASANASKLNQAALSLLGVPSSAPFNSTFTVTPGGGSGSASLVVTTSGVCSISGNDVTMTSGTGSCAVKVNRAGDDNYDAAAEVTASASASKLSQAALSLVGVPASAPYNSTFTVTPGGGSGSASLVVTTSGVCTVSGNDVTMTSGTGSCTVKVNRAGDANYDAATEVTASANASKLSQAALSLLGVPSSAPFNSTFTVTPGGGSGSASLVVTTSGVCSISGNDVTMTSGTGSCTVKVNRAGDDNYNAASEITASAAASKIGQAALSLSGVPASAPFNSTFTVTPGGGSSSASLVVTTSGVCSVSGNDVTMTSGTGTCTVKVNRAGDNNYNAATEVSASATATKINQTALSLSGVPASAPFNSTFTVTPGGGSGSASLVVTTSGVCSVSGNDVTMTSGTGSCIVKVNRAGDDNYNAASEVTASATATKLNQAALSLLGVPATAPYNSSFTVTPGGGSSSAALVVTTTGVCSISGNDVTMTSGTGSCTVKVNRAGDANYNPASEVTASAAASKIGQAALSLLGVPATAPYNSSFTVTPGGGSSSAALVVTTSGVCSISGSSVTMTSGTGSCTVKVNRAGDDNYNAAAEVAASAAAARIGQAALTVTSPTAGTFGQKYAPAATGGSGTGAVSFGVGASTACAIVATGPDTGKVEITSGTGSCAVTASKAADTNYEAATSPALPVALSKAAQTVTFGQPASPQTFGASFAVNPTASSGLAVAVAAAGGCSVAPASPGYTVTMTSGTTACVLSASQPGNNDYLAATAAAGSALERTVAAAKAPATLTFTLALPAKTYGDPEFGVAGYAAAGASGIAVTFSSTTPTVCTVSAAGQVQLLKSGSCTVRAVQAASADYSAGQVDQSFAVGKRALAVEYTGDNYAATGGPTINTATIRLSATLQRTGGGTLGNLGLARVRFMLSKQGGGSQTVYAMADAAGNAMATATVAADNDNQWIVQTSIDPDNAYWSGDFDTDALTVVLGSTEKRTTGGGWIPDAQSANGKANFGFSVAYQKNGSPRGNLTYVYRGTDGYDYVVKSNSWQGGALTFDNRDASLAAFSGRATVQRIDRATGLADPGWPAGNYTFTVDGMDGDLKSPRVRDTFAITIMDNDGRIWRQVGTRTAPVQLGGGNVAVQSR